MQSAWNRLVVNNTPVGRYSFYLVIVDDPTEPLITIQAYSIMAKTIHSMIRVLDEQRSIDFYNKAFDLKVADRLDFESFTLVYLSNADQEFELELTINKDRDQPYDLGEGYGHLAVSVDNINAEHARISDLGLSPKDIVEFERDGALLAKFFFIKDPDGYDIEVLQRHGRFK